MCFGIPVKAENLLVVTRAGQFKHALPVVIDKQSVTPMRGLLGYRRPLSRKLP